MATITGNFFGPKVKKVVAWGEVYNGARLCLYPLGEINPIVFSPFDCTIKPDNYGHSATLSENGFDFKFYVHLQGHIPYPNNFNGFREFSAQTIQAGYPLGVGHYENVPTMHYGNWSSVGDIGGRGLTIEMEPPYGEESEWEAEFRRIFPFIDDLTKIPTVYDFESSYIKEGVVFEYMPCNTNVRYIDIKQVGDVVTDGNLLDYLIDSNYKGNLGSKFITFSGNQHNTFVWVEASQSWELWDKHIPDTDRLIVFSEYYPTGEESFVNVSKSKIYGESSNNDFSVRLTKFISTSNRITTYSGGFAPINPMKIIYGNNLSLIGWSYQDITYATPRPSGEISPDYYPFAPHSSGWRPLCFVDSSPNTEADIFLSENAPRTRIMPIVAFNDFWGGKDSRSFLYIDLDNHIDQRLTIPNDNMIFGFNKNRWWGEVLPSNLAGESWGVSFSEAEYILLDVFVSGKVELHIHSFQDYDQRIFTPAAFRSDSDGTIIPILCYLCFRKYGRITPYYLKDIATNLFK